MRLTVPLDRARKGANPPGGTHRWESKSVVLPFFIEKTWSKGKLAWDAQVIDPLRVLPLFSNCHYSALRCSASYRTSISI